MNKYEKAIKNVNADISGIPYFHDVNTCTTLKDVEALQQLVERATPKKATHWDNEADGQCDCGYFMNYIEHNFCANCGQALDWSE